MAAAIRENKGTLVNGSRSNSVLPAPSTIVDGDILLAVLIVGAAAAPTVTPPDGFAQITGYPIEYGKADPWYVKINAFVKTASSESGNYTFNHTTANSEGIIYAISGADTSSPATPTATKNTYLGGGPPWPGQVWTALGLTTPRDGSAVFFVAACWDAAGPTVPPTGTTPTFTEDFDGGSTGVFYAASGVLTTAGATGDKDANNANSSSENVWGAGLICIQAAAAGASVELEGFRFRNDDGSESTATWKANQDTNITLAADTAFRLRETLNATGDPASMGAQAEYRYKPSGGAFGSFIKINLLG